MPEASGAAWMDINGKARLVVISDSGHDGAYGLVDPETGETVEQGKLPLGEGGNDDLEGAASRGGKLYVISSAGWMRVYTRAAAGFDLVEGPYAMGPIDLPPKGGMGDKPPEGTGMVCDATITNCGRNYEGLCLSEGSDACVGWAASKADGHLYCVVEKDGKLAVQYEPRVKITKPGALADCAISNDGRVFAGSNLFDMGRVYEVVGGKDVRDVAALGLGFPETMAVRDDVVIRMSDTGGAPSLMGRFRCKR